MRLWPRKTPKPEANPDPVNAPPRGGIVTAYVRRMNGGGFYGGDASKAMPDHFQHERVQGIPAGDITGIRQHVNDSDFYAEGKPFPFPGVNKNIFTAIPQINSFALRDFGFVRNHVGYQKLATVPLGQMTPLGGDVNIDTPQPMSYSDFATYAGDSYSGIHGVLKGGL